MCAVCFLWSSVSPRLCPERWWSSLRHDVSSFLKGGKRIVFLPEGGCGRWCRPLWTGASCCIIRQFWFLGGCCPLWSTYPTKTYTKQQPEIWSSLKRSKLFKQTLSFQTCLCRSTSLAQ
jgi:hypothetical protein